MNTVVNDITINAAETYIPSRPGSKLQPLRDTFMQSSGIYISIGSCKELRTLRDIDQSSLLIVDLQNIFSNVVLKGEQSGKIISIRMFIIKCTRYLRKFSLLYEITHPLFSVSL